MNTPHQLLSDEEIKKIADWIGEKIPGSKCLKCGHEVFGISGVMLPQMRTGGRISFGGPTVPLVVVCCDRCGYAEFYSAVKLGIDVS